LVLPHRLVRRRIAVRRIALTQRAVYRERTVEVMTVMQAYVGASSRVLSVCDERHSIAGAVLAVCFSPWASGRLFDIGGQKSAYLAIGDDERQPVRTIVVCLTVD
jgi:hypothetical protein